MTQQNDRPAKIRQIGKATRIFARIISIATFVSFILTLCAALLLFCIPNNALTVSGSTTTQVQVDQDNLGNLWTKLIHIDGLQDEISDGLANSNIHLTLIDTGLSVDGTIEEFQITLRGLCWMIACTGLSILLISAFFWFVARLGQTLEASPSPFTLPVVRCLKEVGWAMVGWTLGGSILQGAGEAAVSGNAAALGWDFAGSLGYGSVLIALLFLALAYIFQYGVQLQAQADTTL